MKYNITIIIIILNLSIFSDLMSQNIYDDYPMVPSPEIGWDSLLQNIKHDIHTTRLGLEGEMLVTIHFDSVGLVQNISLQMLNGDSTIIRELFYQFIQKYFDHIKWWEASNCQLTIPLYFVKRKVLKTPPIIVFTDGRQLN